MRHAAQDAASSKRSRPASGSIRSTTSSSTATGDRVGRLLERWRARARQSGVELPFSRANTPYINTIPAERAAPLSRQSRDRAAHQEPRPLERDGDGGPRQPDRRRHRRPHLDVRLGGHAVRSRLQPLLPRARAMDGDGDQIYFQGHASPGIYARAFLEGRSRASSSRTSAASCSRAAGLSSLSASLADAGLLGVPDGLDGPRADHGDLSGALQPLPGGPRPQDSRPTPRSGRFSATANATSRSRSARSRSRRARSSTT